MNGVHEFHAVVVNDADILRRRSRQPEILDGNEHHLAVGSGIAFVRDDDRPPLPMRDVVVEILRIMPRRRRHFQRGHHQPYEKP